MRSVKSFRRSVACRRSTGAALLLHAREQMPDQIRLILGLIGPGRQSEGSPGPRAIAHVVPQTDSNHEHHPDVITDLSLWNLSGRGQRRHAGCCRRLLNGDPEFASMVQNVEREPTEPCLLASGESTGSGARGRQAHSCRNPSPELDPCVSIFLTLLPLSSPSGPTDPILHVARRATVGLVLDSRRLLLVQLLTMQRQLRAAGL